MAVGRGQRRTYARVGRKLMPLVITTLVLAAGAGVLMWWGYRPEQWDQPLIRRTGVILGLAAFAAFAMAVWASFATDESELARALLSNWFDS